MQVFVCDRCEKIIDEVNGNGVGFKAETKDGRIEIELDQKRHWCNECARKAKNKLAMLANAELKKRRSAANGKSI